MLGFHPKDRDVLARRLEVLKLDHPLVNPGTYKTFSKRLDYVSPPDAPSSKPVSVTTQCSSEALMLVR